MRAQHTPGLIDLVWGDQDAGRDTERQGQFEITEGQGGQRRFWLVCPGPCKGLSPLALRPVSDGSPQSWEFNGNTEAPTLSPSIDHRGCWHGFLINGEFQPC